MSIFKLDGVEGRLETGRLPSGDMTVRGPAQGRLEQIMFDVCRSKGRRDTNYGGWIVPKKDAATVTEALSTCCVKISG